MAVSRCSRAARASHANRGDMALPFAEAHLAAARNARATPVAPSPGDASGAGPSSRVEVKSASLFALHDASSLGPAAHDGRALRILAKTIYRELRQSGLDEHDVLSLAGELLGLVAADVRHRRGESD